MTVTFTPKPDKNCFNPFWGKTNKNKTVEVVNEIND